MHQGPLSQADQSWDFHISLGPWFNKAMFQWLNRDFLFTVVPLCRPQPTLFIFTDASLVGWGAHLGDLSASGLWSAYWQTQHINVLELRAVMLALKSFTHILLSTDNMTVAAYLNKERGGRGLNFVFCGYQSVRMVYEKTGVSDSQVRARETKCSGRLAIQERADNAHRVDYPQGDTISDISILRSPSLRSVRH